ncbi:MAG: SGNH/GDSL hydrolase family protein [Tepidiformaceae bacterium]
MSEQHPGARFLALGDSYTIGERVGADERWPVQLAAMLRAAGVPVSEPEIIARTGWTTDELEAGIGDVRPIGGFALVSLLIGVNNQFRGASADEYRAQFKQLLARAIAFAAGEAERVIVVSIPDWGATPFAEGMDRNRIGEEIDAFNAINRDEAASAGARYVNITPGSKLALTDAALVADDGLHPSAKMYRMWAEAVLPKAITALTAPD